MELHECIALLLSKGNTVLAEKRKLTKKVVPGATVSTIWRAPASQRPWRLGQGRVL